MKAKGSMSSTAEGIPNLESQVWHVVGIHQTCIWMKDQNDILRTTEQALLLY